MHAQMALDAMQAGKSVFVEKPLALTNQELDQIIEAHQSNNVNVSVGFNRRFAPMSVQMRNALGDNTNPINIVATMNAGFIPKNVWIHDMDVGRR